MSSVLDAWAAVLDGSLAELAQASASPRTYDRHTIVRLGNAWTNNAGNFFTAAAARTARHRERSAREGLRWMAELGADRRAWILDRAAAAGHHLDLPEPAFDASVPYRDYRGVVCPPRCPLTPEIAETYDLATAILRNVLVERSGSGLRGSLLIAVDRRYESARHEPAELEISFEKLVAGRLHPDDASGLELELDEDVRVRVGRTGLLRASRATVRISDADWHLSAPGRRADAATGAPRLSSPPANSPAVNAAGLAGLLFGNAMLEVRGVASLERAAMVPVRQIAATFAGAGRAAVVAGSSVRRQAAFRRLVLHWIEAGGPELAAWFRRELESMAVFEHALPGLRAEAVRLLDATSLSSRFPAPPEGPATDLLLVQYAAENSGGPASAQEMRAVPEAHGWGRRMSVVEEFRLDLRDFGEGTRFAGR